MFQIKVAEEIKTHILCSVTPPPPPPENRHVYEIMWKTVVEPERPQMTIRRMRFVCWITKGTDRICNTLLKCYVVRTLPVFIVSFLREMNTVS